MGREAQRGRRARLMKLTTGGGDTLERRDPSGLGGPKAGRSAHTARSERKAQRPVKVPASSQRKGVRSKRGFGLRNFRKTLVGWGEGTWRERQQDWSRRFLPCPGAREPQGPPAYGVAESLRASGARDACGYAKSRTVFSWPAPGGAAWVKPSARVIYWGFPAASPWAAWRALHAPAWRARARRARAARRAVDAVRCSRRWGVGPRAGSSLEGQTLC